MPAFPSSLSLSMLASLCGAFVFACANGESGSGLSGSQPYRPGAESTGDGLDPAATGSDTDGATSTSSPPGPVATTTGGAEPLGDCCVPGDAPGCGNGLVQSCVCSIRSACCEEMWSVACAGLAASRCGGACGDEATDSTAGALDDGSSTAPAPLSCGEVAAMGGFGSAACEVGGNGACGGEGTPTTDCDVCCDACEQGTCGDLAGRRGWEHANCEWNGNGACGGAGVATCDCDFCCEVVL